MNVDIRASTQTFEANIRRITAELNNLGRVAAQLSNQQFSPISPSALGDAEELEKTLRQIMAMHPSIATAVRASGQNPGTPTAVNWGNVPLTPNQVRTMFQHIGGGQQRFTREDANTIGDSIAKAFGRFFGGVGCGAGQVGGSAISGGFGAGGFSGMGLLRGGLLGAGLFGAYKAGQALSEGYESAKTLAIEMDKLKRQMGDIGVSFDVLTSAAEAAAQGLEVNSVEAGKLMSEFNRLSGGVKNSSDAMEGTRAGIGLSKAFGLDPSSGVGFLANMRNISRGGSAEGDRRLALMIGDVVTRSGMNGRTEEIMQAVQQFATATARISLTNPNMEGFSGAYAGMLSSRIPGLTPETAAALLGQANSAMQNMGAFGEASQTFTMSAFNRYGALNPIQARVLAEGGLYGNRAGAFGQGSVYRRYMMSQGASESEIDKLMGSGAGVSNYEAIRRQLDAQNVDPHIKAEMAKNFFGLSSISQAMAMMSIKPEEIGKTEKMLGGRGINLRDYNETGIMTLSRIANAGGIGDLQGVAADMLGRQGKGALDQKQRNTLEEALKKYGGEAGFPKLQETLADLAAEKDKQETLGSQMLDQQKRIESAMTSVGKDLLGPLTDIKEVLMAGFGISESKARDRVLGIRKQEINEEFDKKLKPIDEQISSARSSLREAKALRLLGVPRSDELVQGWEEKLKELESQRGGIVGERDIKLSDTDAQYRAEAGGARGIRNNNPGNIVKTSSAWEGEVAGSDSRFKSFDTPESGIRAIGRNLLSYKSKGLTTVSEIIGRWAPPGENDTAAYIARVCKVLGVGPHDKIDVSDPKVMKALTSAIITHENGKNPYSDKQITSGVNSALGVNDTTPLPDKDPLAKYPENWRRQQSLAPWEVTMRLLDTEGRQRAAPVNISVPVPTATGR